MLRNTRTKRICALTVWARSIGMLLIGMLYLPALLSAQDPNISRLAEELQNSNISIRRKAAIALGRASYPQSVNLLQAALSTEQNVSIRLEIVRALRHIAFQRFPGYPEALRALGAASDDGIESNELVRLRASEALWEAAKKDLLNPVPFLQRNLSDESQRLRLSAVRMLHKLGTPQTLAPLGRTAIDKNQSDTIRLKAIEAIGAISLSDPGPVGRTIAENNRRTTELLGQPPLIGQGSLERRHEKQIGYLSVVVRDLNNSAPLMLRAVKSIGQVKDKSAIAALQEIINTHSNQAVRKQATRVLSHILARQYE
jgi:HEAT repeat protein